MNAIRQAVLDTRRAADWLFERGYRRVGIVGTSVGSCIGFLTFAHDERFSVDAARFSLSRAASVGETRLGHCEVGNRSRSESGIQVLPIDNVRPETVDDGRIAMEADGRSRGARDVARRPGELR